MPWFLPAFSALGSLSLLSSPAKITKGLLLDPWFGLYFSKDTICKICHKPTTVITYKLHVSTGRRCQTPDCCPPARSLGKCPHCDRRVWSHLPWSWGWHKTLRCHPQSPPGWVSSGRHPERQHQRKGGQCVAVASPGLRLIRAPTQG